MKQINFRQKKIVQPRQSVQQSLIDARNIKREQKERWPTERFHRKKRTKKRKPH